MENTGSRDQLIKSILIMAGIPLAISVACSLFARIKDSNISSLKDQTHETEFVTLCGDDHGVHETEVMSTEVENKKFVEIVIEYRKALGELESSHSENGLLQRRVKKVLKKTRQSLRLIRKQNLKIQEQEAQMLSAEIEFKRKEIVIEGYEREAEDMRALISRLSEEKNDVLNKLEITLASKVEAERILVENYNQVVEELQNLQTEREGELKELIYLRWCHACLRQELAKGNQLEQERKSENKLSDDEPSRGRGGARAGSIEPTGYNVAPPLLRGNVAPAECTAHKLDNKSVVHHEEPLLAPGQQHTKRRSLVRKFKKWVEGSEKHREAKCLRSRSVGNEAEKRQSDGRKSFSSVEANN